MTKLRIFYAASGPGDLLESHRRWKAGEHNPTEVARTFSGQIEDFCRDVGADAYFVSTHPRIDRLEDPPFVFEHRPKRARRGLAHHLGEVAYGLGLLKTALRFRADIALIDSGATHSFMLSLFRFCGIRVVPILHNTLWPNGFPPRRPIPRLVLLLDSLFWKRGPTAVIAVSPECERQVHAIAADLAYPILQTRAQFRPEYFARIKQPPSHERRPFRIMFIGRIVRSKGVFDILEIAARLRDSHPGLVHWDICGTGHDFEELRSRHAELALEGVVSLRGWTSLDDLITVYDEAHAAIVPTRSSFTEGLAMTAAEAVLAGRPVITNPVVPALEILRPACVAAVTDDSDSHLQAVLQLATDGTLHRSLCAACPRLSEQFYDQSLGLAAVLKRALSLGTAAPVSEQAKGLGSAPPA